MKCIENYKSYQTNYIADKTKKGKVCRNINLLPAGWFESLQTVAGPLSQKYISGCSYSQRL